MKLQPRRVPAKGSIKDSARATEEAVIAAALVDVVELEKATQGLTPDHFGSEQRAIIWGSILELYELPGGSTDLPSVLQRLTETGQIDEAGGTGYVTSLLDKRMTGVRTEALISQVIEAGRRRSRRSQLQSLLSMIDEGHPLEEVDESLEAAIMDFSSDSQDGRGLAHTVGSTADTLQYGLDAADGLHGSGIHTGILPLDLIVPSLDPTDLVYVAARPSMGKTALMNHLLLHSARQGRRCAVFSMEMDRSRIIRRLLASMSKVPLKLLRTGRASAEHWKLLLRATVELGKLPIWIDESSRLTPGRIRAGATKLARQIGGIDIIFVDYAQLLHSGLKNKSVTDANYDLAHVSRAMKELAKELGIPVFVLSQMNRGIENRADPTPKLSDLRDSGALEQDGDVIAFLDHARDSQKRIVPGYVDIIVRKQRDGLQARARAVFLKHVSSFYNASPRVLAA